MSDNPMQSGPAKLSYNQGRINLMNENLRCCSVSS
jgi:hypothetical protein